MLLLRKIVFYIFALIYLVLCPLLVARMLGFVFNPLTHRLVKTGLVYVSTNPPDASVYIDGRPAHQKTPTVIRDLTPGRHFIRIESEGYTDWERNVPVVGKKATVLANILLIPEAWPIHQISRQAYRNIFPVDDDLLLAANTLLKDIDIFHTTGIELDPADADHVLQGTGRNLFSKNSIYADGTLLRLFTAAQSPFILLEAKIKDQHRFLWVNLKENPPIIEDISDLLTDNPVNIAWKNNGSDNIFAFYPDHINRIDTKVKEVFLQDPARLPRNLRSAPSPSRFLINGDNDLLVRQGTRIRIYPKEEFDAPRSYDIARSKASTNLYFEEKNGMLFYLDERTGSLFTAQLLQYHPILNIPIPDALKNQFKENSALDAPQR